MSWSSGSWSGAGGHGGRGGAVRRTWRRRLLITSGVLVVCIGTWLGICFAVITHPDLDQPTKADAIVVLGEPDGYAVDLALRLLNEGISNELMMSIPFGGWPVCTNPPPGVHADCLIPDPKTTQGDAELIRTIALQQKWRHIVVITWTAHVSRSRLLIDRCFTGSVQMVSYNATSGITGWLKEYVHQTGGYLKAVFDRTC